MEKHSLRARKPGLKHTGAHRMGNRSCLAMKSSVGAALHTLAVREAQARQRAALRNDRRRFCTRGTVGGPRSASAIRAASRNRPPQQLDRLKSGIGMGLFLFALLLLSACHRAMPEQATWAGTIDLA